MRKGQVGLETMTVIAFLLLLTIPLGLLLFSGTGQGLEDVSIMQANQAVVKITNTANDVYIQGQDSKASIFVLIPPKVNRILINGNEITFRMETSSGTVDIVGISVGNLTEEGSGQPITAIVDPNIYLINVSYQQGKVRLERG
ncbi:hypothetical protein HY570_02955 [Candidatus Micrarchaeota archaeon]|nr:hypothetical protein [Candidatus Micrarchaeota archaeon]